MNRGFTLLLCSLFLVSLLTACGCTAKQAAGDQSGSQNDSTAMDPPTTGDTMTNNANDTTNGSGSGGSLMDEGGSTAQEGMNDGAGAGENAGSSGAGSGTGSGGVTGGVSYDQMLRNARVHDKDGDLTDRENSVTPGSAA